ncbi:MAG: hypothetical protein U0K87_10850, partial [Ruminococcus sp.]|nr:hypothetical protein [Ruminococcus sp.]
FRLTSDSASRRTPLPSANTSYCQACSGLSPPSYCPFWANTQNKAATESAALKTPEYFRDLNQKSEAKNVQISQI